MPQFVQVYNRRETWLASRRLSIGGSDAATLYGAGFLSQLELQLEKQGRLPPSPPSLQMRLGLAAEPEISREAEQTLGMESVEPPGLAIWRSSDLPYMHATPDRFLFAPGDRPQRVRVQTLARRAAAVLSLKLRNAALREAWRDGEPPLDALIQVQHEMILTGVRRAFIAVAFGNGQAFEVVGPIELHERWAEQHVARCARWWKTHVIEGLPVRQFDPRDDETLQLLHPRSAAAKTVRRPAAWAPKLRRYETLTRRASVIDAGRKRLAAEVKAEMGDAEVMLIEGCDRAFSWRSGVRREAAREARVVDTRRFLVTDPPKAEKGSGA